MKRDPLAQTGEADFKLIVDDLGLSKPIDSYYYILDQDSLDNNSTKDEARLIRKHFHALADILTEVDLPDKVFLPVEYSDEYIGCFRLQIDEDGVSVDYGYTTDYQGANHWPRNLSRFKPSTFTPLTATIRSKVHAFATALECAVP